MVRNEDAISLWDQVNKTVSVLEQAEEFRKAQQVAARILRAMHPITATRALAAACALMAMRLLAAAI